VGKIGLCAYCARSGCRPHIIVDAEYSAELEGRSRKLPQ
jgi:hypothetical protein